MKSSQDQFLLYIDTSATTTPSYKQICPLNFDYDSGETLDTWNNLCSEFTNSVRVALDPTWSMSFKFASDDPAGVFILSKEYSTGTSASCKFRFVNLLKGSQGKQIDFTGTLSNISYSAVTEEVLQIDFDVKIYDNSTFVEADYSLSI